MEWVNWTIPHFVEMYENSYLDIYFADSTTTANSATLNKESRWVCKFVRSQIKSEILWVP